MALDQGRFGALRHYGDVRRDGAPAIRLSHARGPMLVEFIGIPGSGKSTLRSAIVSELRRDGLSIITEHDYFRWARRPLYKKVGAVIGNGVRTWRFVWHVYRFLYCCTLLRGRPLLRMGYHLSCRHVWLSRTVAHSPPVPILVDEFGWHLLTKLLRDYPATDLSGSPFARMVALFYPSCDVYWIFKTVPVELAVQRISNRHLRENRSPWFIERLSPDRRHVLLKRQTQLYQSIYDAIRSRYGDNVHCVDGARPIPEQVRYINSIIAKSLQQETSAAPMSDPSLCA